MDKKIRRPWFVGKRWLKIKVEMEQMSGERFINENRVEVIEKTCTFFGCGKRLSMRQAMAGNRCEDHPKGMKQFNNLPL